MSELQTPTKTEQPEKGAAEIHEQAGIALKPLESIRDLQPNVESFALLLDTLPASGSAYASKEDFAAIVTSLDVSNGTSALSGPEVEAFDYMRSEYLLSANREAVDFDALNRKSYAFPENPKASKIAYIIDDLKAALAAETNAARQEKLKLNIIEMTAFQSTLGTEKEDPQNGDQVKQYFEVINNADASTEDKEGARKALFNARQHAQTRASVYSIVSQYFPSDRSKQAIVTMVPGRELGEPVTAVPVKSTETTPDARAKEIAHERKELHDIRDSENGLADKIARRENGRGLQRRNADSGEKSHRQTYSKHNYRIFQLEHIGDNENRFDKLVNHVLKEAADLEKVVNARRNVKADLSDDDQSIMPELQIAISEIREELATTGYDEKGIYDSLQNQMFYTFDEIITGERQSRLRQKVSGTLKSERVQNARAAFNEKFTAEKRARAKKFGGTAVKWVVGRTEKQRAKRKAAKNK